MRIMIFVLYLLVNNWYNQQRYRDHLFDLMMGISAGAAGGRDEDGFDSPDKFSGSRIVDKPDMIKAGTQIMYDNIGEIGVIGIFDPEGFRNIDRNNDIRVEGFMKLDEGSAFDDQLPFLIAF